MIMRIIDFCAQRRGAVIGAVLALCCLGGYALAHIKLDAIPDLSEPQVIVFSEWSGKDPSLIEDQVTYPIVSSLVAAPRVRDVRGLSMFGMSFVYVIFDEGTDLYWARSRVLEYLSGIQNRLPENVTPRLGPDATGIGWVYQYTLEDTSGNLRLDELRTLQDFTLRYALASVEGVAEVASVGGYEKQYQVKVDPEKMRAYGLGFGEVSRAIRGESVDVGGRVLELSGREYYVRGRGYVHSPQELEQVAVRREAGKTPVLLKDVASVELGPNLRRGLLEWNGEGEAVGGIVVMRFGENAHQVIARVKAKLHELTSALPKGVHVVTAYDRSSLIERAIATLRQALSEEMLVVGLVISVFLLHFRSALLPIITLPVAVLLAFIPMYLLDVPATIMSLGGIAIAIGATVDAEIVMVEACHKALEHARPGDNRRNLLARAAREVTPAIFFSLLIIAISFLPVFALNGQAGRLFRPLAYTKTFVMLASALLSITFAPALRDLLIRGRIRSESTHPISRLIRRVYEPFVYVALRKPKTTLLIGLFAALSAIPLASELGHEFMPTLNEGDILYMPTTYPGISIEEGKRELSRQDAILRSFPEVATVFGKIGRAESATDPAPLSMIETTVQLKPRTSWPSHHVERFYSRWAPAPLHRLLSRFFPEHTARTHEELVRALDAALQRPGFSNAFSMPIKTRIDMQVTGIRTPVGIKIFGHSLDDIERTGNALERTLRDVPGTRGVFYERNVGGSYVDITPDRERLTRAGLSLTDAQEAIEAAVGGVVVGSTLEGRGRFSILARFNQDARADVAALGRLPLSLPSAGGTPSAFVPLGDVADIRVSEGPPMLRDEDGLLVGYVYVDLDERHDMGGYVKSAQASVAEATRRGEVKLGQGSFLKWSGQFELWQEMSERMKILIPLTLLSVVLLLYFAFRNLIEVLIVLLSIPFALIGSVWLLWLLDYRLSTAVWVGVIALIGLATQTGVVMIVYIDAAYERRKQAGKIRTLSDIIWAHMEGTVQRVRPKLMTVATMFTGLVPLLWATGSGADVMKRIAAPMIGGLFTSAFLTLELIPVIYTYWRNEQLVWERVQRHDPARFVWLEAAAKLQWTAAAALAATAVGALYVELSPGPRNALYGAAACVFITGLGVYLRVRARALSSPELAEAVYAR